MSKYYGNAEVYSDAHGIGYDIIVDQPSPIEDFRLEVSGGGMTKEQQANYKNVFMNAKHEREFVRPHLVSEPANECTAGATATVCTTSKIIDITKIVVYPGGRCCIDTVTDTHM